MRSPSDYNYCKSKIQYHSEKNALSVGIHLGYDNAYRCPKCKYWHLTSDPKFKEYEGIRELFELTFE